MTKAWLKRSLVMGSLLALGVIPAAAQDDPSANSRTDPQAPKLRAHLGGFQEVPAVSTPGRGRFTARATEGGIAFVLRYTGLQGERTPVVSLHLAQGGVRGGLITVLCGGDVRPECPAGAGTVKGVIRPSEIVGPEEQGIRPGQLGEVLRAMLHGKTYINVRTTAFPRGEIRGQIVTNQHD